MVDLAPLVLGQAEQVVAQRKAGPVAAIRDGVRLPPLDVAPAQVRDGVLAEVVEAVAVAGVTVVAVEGARPVGQIDCARAAGCTPAEFGHEWCGRAGSAPPKKLGTPRYCATSLVTSPVLKRGV